MNMYSNETLFQGMETCASDMNDEYLVTDLVHELSTGLEIPFLLGDNIRSVGKTENANVLDTMFYEDPVVETQGDDLYFSFTNNCENVLSIKEENNDLEHGGFVRTHSTSGLSGSGSGSECSSTEFWSTKIELDTPPITPPDERISPDNVFLLPAEEFKFIPISAEEYLNGENKVKSNYKSIDNKVRIQPKPVSTSLNIFETQPSQTVTFNVFSGVSSTHLNNQDSLESSMFLNFSNGKKKSLLTKKDLELLQAKRKQERMIRNRESAYLSRKRKKEHVANLEKQVQDLQAENRHLRIENSNLRQRLAKYEKVEPLTGKKSTNLFSESPRKTTALLALLFTVCLNIGSFSSLMNEKRVYKNDVDVVSENIVPNYPSELRHARSLLWADNVDIGSLNSSYTNLTKTSCPLSVNQTESIRLESELRKWIGDEDYSRQAKYNVSKISQYFYLGERPSQRKNVSKRKLRALKSSFQRKNLEMDMYQMNVLNFNTFFEAIHRRDDTFYLVSFSSDHLLLPALSHNQTSRPKMSLMLPAFLSNGTMADQVEMMQIDCEVTNTQLLSVNENDIPSQMRPYSNSTSRSKNKPKEKAKKFEEYFVSDLPGTLVPAENITFKAEKNDLTYANSSGNHSKFFYHNAKNSVSKSKDFEVLNFTVANSNFEERNSPHLEYKKKPDLFYNQSSKQDQNAVEFTPNTRKNFFKLLKVTPTTNPRAIKFNSERGPYKSYRNTTKFLFN